MTQHIQPALHHATSSTGVADPELKGLCEELQGLVATLHELRKKPMADMWLDNVNTAIAGCSELLTICSSHTSLYAIPVQVRVSAENWKNWVRQTAADLTKA